MADKKRRFGNVRDFVRNLFGDDDVSKISEGGITVDDLNNMQGGLDEGDVTTLRAKYSVDSSKKHVTAGQVRGKGNRRTRTAEQEKVIGE